jgi:uncharacterized protein YtpQ (UPF0354 family)
MEEDIYNRVRRVHPRIRSTADEAMIAPGPQATAARSQVAGDLVVVFALSDDPDAPFLSPDELEQLRLHDDEILAMAKENVWRSMRDTWWEPVGGIFAVLGGEPGLAPLTLLFPDVWSEMAWKVTGELLVSAPCQSTLFVAGVIEDEGISRESRTELLERSRMAYQAGGDDRLSSGLFCWRDRNWVAAGSF